MRRAACGSATELRLLPHLYAYRISIIPRSYDAIRTIIQPNKTTDAPTDGHGRDAHSTAVLRALPRAPTSPPSKQPTGDFPTLAPSQCHNAADAAREFTCAQWLASDGVDCSSVEGACALSCDECGPTSHPTMRYDMNSRGHPTFAFDGWRLEGRTEPPAPSGVVVAGGDASYFCGRGRRARIAGEPVYRVAAEVHPR